MTVGGESTLDSAIKLWRYPSELPVVERRSEIIDAIQDHQVVVIVSDTGSGKTTQLPKMVAEALGITDHQRQIKEKASGRKLGLIGCTQPRRIAAVSVAKRVAEELEGELGAFIGYQVRFDEVSSEQTAVKFMTDGILLAETQGDPDLKRYAALIIDEAHERSLNIDFLLGYLRRLLGRRPDLKVVISSATLDAGSFVKFFSGLKQSDTQQPDVAYKAGAVALIEAEGRMFPVEEKYLPGKDDEDLVQLVGRGADYITELDPSGDILVFLPGEREIRGCTELLEGRRYRNTEVLPLFARLGMGEQQKIFQPGNRRRIVLATNVAETSLTIPRIACVIDSGLARLSRWNAAKGVQRLQIEPISQASARQRKGRCGRVREGLCLRLYEEEDFADRPEFTEPEIRRSSLAGVILRMKVLGLPEISDFPFLDPPNPKAVAEGYRTLREIGGLDRDRKLTEIGRELGRLPVDPRMGRMLLEGQAEGCLRELLVIVAGLETTDPRERPAEKQREADAAHAKWQDAESDFISMLNLWADLVPFFDGRRWRWNQLRKFCGRHYLNAKRVTEWGNVVDELARITNYKTSELLREGAKVSVNYDGVHRALLAGAPRQFGLWDKENRAYRSAAGGFFAIFPGSGLFGQKKRAEWVMGLELMETSKLWARRAAVIEPAWLEVVAPHLCRHLYGEAFWDSGQGAVYGKERVICGGLHVIEGRRVHYGRVDVKGASEVFLRDGLLGGGMTRKTGFSVRLEQLRAEIKSWEDKLRRPGVLWSEEAVLEFLQRRVPKGISTAASFLEWYEEEEGRLDIAIDDVVMEDLAGLQFFPDTLSHGETEYAVYYHCAPGERDDGVTLGVHVDQLPGMPEWFPGWGVDGNLEERAALLIRSLPKDYRRLCQPIGDVAWGFARYWEDRTKKGDIFTALSTWVAAEVGAIVPAEEFARAELPPELITKVWVCNDDSEELAMGTSLAALKLELREWMRARFEAAANAEVERRGISQWDGEALPEKVMTAGGPTYPVLCDEGKTVGVITLSEPLEAQESHRRGGARLFVLGGASEVEGLQKRFPLGIYGSVELARLGVAVEDLILLTAEGVAAKLGVGHFPRSPKGFAELSDRGRGMWFEIAEEIGRVIEDIAVKERSVRSWIDGNCTDRNLGPVARDLAEELGWLFRENWAWRANYRHFMEYPLRFTTIETRIERVKSLPLIKDLEKMERLRGQWNKWYAAWWSRRERIALWEAGMAARRMANCPFCPGHKISAKSLGETSCPRAR